MIVAKFGGTSVADAEAIGRLIDIVRSRSGSQPIVVVSALARVTDALLTLGHQCGSGDGAGIDAAIEALLARHESIARALPGCSAAVRSDRGRCRGAQTRGHCRSRPAAIAGGAGRGGRTGRALELSAGGSRHVRSRSRCGLGRHPIHPGDGRALRARHPVCPGAEQTGSRPPEAVGRSRTHSGDAGLHRSHRYRGRRPRWAEAAPTLPRRCSAPRSTRSGSRSGPTWTD